MLDSLSRDAAYMLYVAVCFAALLQHVLHSDNFCNMCRFQEARLAAVGLRL